MDQPKLTWLKEGAAFLLGDGGPIVAWKHAATDADFLDVLDSQFGGSLVPSYVARSSDRAFEQWSRELGMRMPA